MVFWDVAVDQTQGEVHDEWDCPHCKARLCKNPRKASAAQRVERAFASHFDRALGQNVRQARQTPVLIKYSIGNKRHEKRPDADDLALIYRIDEQDIPLLVSRSAHDAKRLSSGVIPRAQRNPCLVSPMCITFYTQVATFRLLAATVCRIAKCERPSRARRFASGVYGHAALLIAVAHDSAGHRHQKGGGRYYPARSTCRFSYA
jgi:hypothetical protein